MFTGGCAIRMEDTGPSIHVNQAHTCVGVSGVGIGEDGRIQVLYSVAGPTSSITVDADETLTGRGLLAGVDTGERYATITLFDTTLGRPLDLNAPADYDRVSGQNANLWLTLVRAERPDQLGVDTAAQPLSTSPPHADDDPILLGCRIAYDASNGTMVREGAGTDACSGIESAYIDDRGRIAVEPDSGQPVISINTTPNGYTTNQGLDVGASGGVNAVVLQVHDSRTGRVLDLRTAEGLSRLGEDFGFSLGLRQEAHADPE